MADEVLHSRIEQLERDNQRLRDDLEDAGQRMRSLEAAADGEGFDGMLKDMERAETRIVTLTRDLDRADAEARELADVNRRLESEVDALKEQTEAQDAQMQGMQGELSTARGKLKQARQKTDFGAREMARLRSQVDRHKGSNEDASGELAAVTAELTDARRLVQQLRTEVSVLQHVNEELEAKKVEEEERSTGLAAALETAHTELLRLHGELEDKAGESSVARAEAAEARTVIADETRVLQDALQAMSTERDSESQRADEAAATAARLGRELSRVKSETRVAQLEDELQRAQTALVGAGEDNAHLHEQLARAEETIADLVDKVQSVDELQREAAAAARADERDAMSAQLASMEALRAELEAERTRYKELQAQLAEEQVKAEDLKFRNEQYERQYGMSDLVGELDALRAECAKLQADLTAAGEDLKDRTNTVYTLTEIARRLARETGKYPDDVNVFTIYDTGDLMAQQASLVEQYRADNAVLERQVEELQGERVRLMRELRIQARQTGEDGLFYFGLTGEQMRLVNDFAENLRQGKAVVPERDESAALRRQLEAVRRQMFEERAKFAEASLAFNAALQNGEVSGVVARPAAPSPDLAALLSEMRAENGRLREELLARGDAQADRLRQLITARGAGTGMLEDPDADPATARVIKLLQKAMAQGKGLRSKDVPNTLQSLLAAMEARRKALAAAADAAAAAAAEASGRSEAEGRVGTLTASLSEEAAARAQLEGRVRGLQEDLADARGQLKAAPGSGALVPAPPSTPGFRSAVGMRSPWAGGEGPFTPVGRALLTQTLDTSHLPPLAGDWATEVASVHAALVAALEELVRREGAVGALEGTLARYDGSVATMAAQLVALYRAHIAAKRTWAADTAAAKEREDAARSEAAAAADKVARFDALVGDLTDGDAEGQAREGASLVRSLRAHVKRQARRLAEVEAKLPVLAQQLHVTATQAKASDALRREAEAEVLAVRATLSHRILYLELWKRGGEARLARLSEVMTQWVPQAQADATGKALSELRARHAVLLAEEAALRAEHVTLRSTARDAAAAASHNKLLAAQLEQARAQAEGATAQAAALRQLLAGVPATALPAEGAVEGSAPLGRLAEAARPALLAEVARLRASLGDATVRLDASAASARVLQERVSELGGEVAAEAAAASRAEAAAAASRTAQVRAERDADAMATQFAGGLTADAATALRGELDSMRERAEGLEREAQRAQGMADIAADQASAATAMIRSREEEVAALRAQVAEASAGSPDTAILGKLQAEMMALKGSYAAFLRRYATLKTAVHRLRVAATAAETEADQRNAALTLALEDGRVKELALRGELGELRRILAAQSAAGGPGTVSLADITTLNAHVRELSGSLEAANSKADALAAQVRDGEDALAVEREGAACMQSALTDVTRALGAPAAGSGQGSAAAAGGGEQRTVDALAASAREAAVAAAASASSSEARGVVRRLIELHEKVRQSQLLATRTQRQLVRATDEQRLAVRRRGDAEEAVRALEDEVVALRAEAARAEEGKRAALAQAAASQAAAAQAAHSARVAAAVAPDGALDAAAAAGASEAMVTHRVASAQGEAEEFRAQAVAARAEADKWRDAAASAKAAATSASAKVRALRKQLAQAGVDVSDGEGGDSDGSPPRRPSSGSDGGDGFSIDTAGMSTRQVRRAYEGELRRLQSAAAHTVEQLKGLLEGKNATVEQYAVKLAAAQARLAEERGAAAASAAATADAAYGAQQEALVRLREAVEDIRTGAANTGMDAAQAKLAAELGDRVDVLQQQVILRDRRLAEMDAQLTAMATALEGAQQRAASAEAAAAQAGDELKALHDANAGSRLAQTVAALRKALDGKERKVKSLHAALAALKDEFVKAETEHAAAGQAWAAEQEAAASRAEAAEARVEDIRAATASVGDVEALQRKVKALQERLSAARAAAAGLEDAKAALTASLGDAQRQIDGANEAKAVHRAAAERAWGEVKALRSALGEATRSAEADRATFQSRLAELVAQGGAPVGPLGEEGKDGEGMEAGAVGALRQRLAVLEAQNAALRAANFEEAARGDTVGAVPAPAPEAAPAAAAAPAGQRVGGTPAASRDVERKLRRRLEGLTARLHSKTQEAEAAAAELAGVRGALDKAKAEKAALQRRVTGLGRKQQRLDAATSSALAELEPVAELRAKVAEAEEEAARWRQLAEGEMAADLRRAKAEAEGERKRAEAAVSEADASRVRANALGEQLAAVTASTGGAAALRAGESGFVEEANLRDRLAAARRDVAGLEAALLTRDATIAELRFEVEEGGAAVARLQRRVRELGALGTIAGVARGGASGDGSALDLSMTGGGGGLLSPPRRGTSGSRAARLEETVKALKDVVNKQRRELERSKGVGPGSSTPRSDGGSSAASTLAAGRELASARARVARLEAKVAASEETADELRRQVAAKSAEVTRERAGRRAAEDRRRTGRGGPARAPAPAPPESKAEEEGQAARLAGRVAELSAENEALRGELAGLDMGFFEEVEDMKHQLALAQHKGAAFDSYLAAMGAPPFQAGAPMAGSGVGDPRAGTRGWG